MSIGWTIYVKIIHISLIDWTYKSQKSAKVYLTYTRVTSHCVFFLQFSSYDTRGAHSDAPSHWKDDEILESRASFRRKGEPDELLINPVLVSNLLFSSFYEY